MPVYVPCRPLVKYACTPYVSNSVSRDKCQHTQTYSFLNTNICFKSTVLAYTVTTLFGQILVSNSAMQHVTYVNKPAHLSYSNQVPDRNQWPIMVLNIMELVHSSVTVFPLQVSKRDTSFEEISCTPKLNNSCPT